MHLTSPFKKKGDRGRRKRAKGEITTVCSCDNLAQRLSSNSEKPPMHLPLSLHTAVFHRGRAAPPPTPIPTLGRAAAAGAALRAGRADVPGAGGRCTGGDWQPSCPDLAPPLPPTGNFPKCRRIMLVILSQGFFKFCRWDGEERREGGGLGGAGWEGMALECGSASAAGLLGDGSGPAGSPARRDTPPGPGPGDTAQPGMLCPPARPCPRLLLSCHTGDALGLEEGYLPSSPADSLYASYRFTRG